MVPWGISSSSIGFSNPKMLIRIIKIELYRLEPSQSPRIRNPIGIQTKEINVKYVAYMDQQNTHLVIFFFLKLETR